MTIIIKVDTGFANAGIDTELSLEEWKALDDIDKDNYLRVAIIDDIYAWLEDIETGKTV